jgi:hypothetical protein
MYASPQPTVYVGSITATGNKAFLAIDKLPVRARNIKVMLDTAFATDGTNYYDIMVARIDGAGSVTWVSSKLSLSVQGMKAYVWHTILEDATMLSGVTLAVRFVEAGAATLSGVTIGFDLEERKL